MREEIKKNLEVLVARIIRARTPYTVTSEMVKLVHNEEPLGLRVFMAVCNSKLIICKRLKNGECEIHEI